MLHPWQAFIHDQAGAAQARIAIEAHVSEMAAACRHLEYI